MNTIMLVMRNPQKHDRVVDAVVFEILLVCHVCMHFLFYHGVLPSQDSCAGYLQCVISVCNVGYDLTKNFLNSVKVEGLVCHAECLSAGASLYPGSDVTCCDVYFQLSQLKLV